MSFLPNPIACDVCGAIKGDADHWWYALTNRGGAFQLHPWDVKAETQGQDPFIHLCGQVCVIKKLSEWMDQQKPN